MENMTIPDNTRTDLLRRFSDLKVCLCILHHKLFDRGAWGLTESLQVVVSEETSGSGKEEWLLRFLGHKIRIPTRVEYRPADAFRQWHVKEVLQHPFLDGCSS